MQHHTVVSSTSAVGDSTGGGGGSHVVSVGERPPSASPATWIPGHVELFPVPNSGESFCVEPDAPESTESFELEALLLIDSSDELDFISSNFSRSSSLRSKTVRVSYYVINLLLRLYEGKCSLILMNISYTPERVGLKQGSP